MTEKVYHIYAKGQCIYHNLSESKFAETWEMIHRMIDLLDLDLTEGDLSYEELYVSKEVLLNSSH